MDLGDTPAPDKGPLVGAQRAGQWIEILLGLAGTFTALFAAISDKPWILLLGVAVIAGSIAVYLLRRAAIRRRRPKVRAEHLGPVGSAYLRGLLPFERGEKLLGRASDISRLLAKLRSRECRFAYVSGDAGVGKTSLLRAAVSEELEEAGYTVVYVPRTGNDPVAAARRELQRAFAEAGIRADATLVSALSFAAAACRKALVVVWDQFEEFFIAHRTVHDRNPFLEAIGLAYQEPDLDVRFVISLRAEFVDDLRDFAKWIRHPIDERCSHRVRNWDAIDATAVLETAAKHDGVPFAPALREAIIRDLENGGEVRPVELQLVAYRLAEQHIYDVAAYDNAERAAGILKSYVQAIIEPQAMAKNEHRERVARLVLRVLCVDTADAKRPVGLTFDEIVHRAEASINDYNVPVREIAASCLDDAMRTYLVVLDDEQRYNLRHDYLARPILDATAGTQTIEQGANRILDHHLERFKSDSAVIIPRRDLRLIRKYAAPQRKSEHAAVHLIRQSRRRHAIEIAIIAILPFVLATLLFPPTVKEHSTNWDVVHDEWLISDNGVTAVSFTRDGPTRVWRAGTPWATAQLLPIHLLRIRISSNGTWLAGITGAGAIYVWRTAAGLSHNTRPVFHTAPVPERLWSRARFDWGGFSPDEKWIYVRKGLELYVWHPDETLTASAAPLGTFNGCESLWSFSVEFSPKSSYVAVNCKDIYVKHVGANDPFVRFQNLNVIGSLIFSKFERWLALKGSGERLYAIDLPHYRTTTPSFVRIGQPWDVHAVTFAPDEGRIVLRHSDMGFVSWVPGNTSETPPPATVGLSAEDLLATAGARIRERLLPPTTIQFSANSKWIGGIFAGGAVVWPSDMTPGAKVYSTIPNDRDARSLRFSPTARLIAVATGGGETFVFAPGTVPNLSEPVATLPGGDASLRWARDDRHLLAFSGNDVYFGEPPDKLRMVLHAKSPIEQVVVSPDRKKLIVFAKGHLAIVQRRLMLWRYVTLRTLEWPELVPETH
jgi:hypothetical protein